MEKFRVSAVHSSPRYTFDGTEVIVRKSGDKFYANHPDLGCSKGASNAADAIRSLFRDHACMVTKIAAAPKFEVRNDDNQVISSHDTKQEAESAARQYRLDRDMSWSTYTVTEV